MHDLKRVSKFHYMIGASIFVVYTNIFWSNKYYYILYKILYMHDLKRVPEFQYMTCVSIFVVYTNIVHVL